MNENEVIEESAEVVDEIEETEDVSEDAEEDLAEEELEESEEDEEFDEDFEYDEDGNIIIPDEDGEEEENPSSTADAVTPPSDGEGKEEAPKADPRDKELADLRRKLSRLESLGKDAIKAVGLDENDVELGLAGIAAETQGKSARDILDAKKQEEAAAEARAQIESARFEQIAAADLAELHAFYPETRQYKHVKDLPANILVDFCAARDAGFSAKKAYAAANIDNIITTANKAGKKAAMHDSKAHLKSVVPKASKDTSAKMTQEELAEFREMFPDKSDAEIVKLYKSVNK